MTVCPRRIASTRPTTLIPTVLLVAALATLAGCKANYSPNTYASSAVQQASTVQPGIVVGVRPVGVAADTTVGTVTGGAAGGIAGSAAGGGGVSSAIGALGGTLVGGLVGNTVEHATGDTTAFEYIVRETKGDMVSVTQQDTKPLTIGEKVLVIAGKQARVVPDYTVQIQTPPQATPLPTALPDAVPAGMAPVPAAPGDTPPAATPGTPAGATAAVATPPAVPGAPATAPTAPTAPAAN